MKKKIKSIMKTEWYLITLMFKIDLKKSMWYWLIDGLLQFAPLISVVIWKVILDLFTQISNEKYVTKTIWIYLILYLLVQLSKSIFYNIKTLLSEMIQINAMHYLDMEIMNKISTLDLSFFDDPENNEMQTAAQQSQGYICSGLTWMITTLIKILAFASQLALFLSYNKWLGLLYIGTYIPGIYISYRNELKMDQWSIDSIPQNREKDYYKNLLTRSFAAKDLRLYNLVDYYKKKYNDLWNKVRQERSTLFAKGLISSFLASILTYAGLILVIIISVRSVIQGELSIGTLVLYITLSSTMGDEFRTIISSLSSQFEITVPRVIRFQDFLNFNQSIDFEGPEILNNTIDIKKRKEKKLPHNRIQKKRVANANYDETYNYKHENLTPPDIEFKNVYFKYPNQTQYVIKNLSFKIESGKKVALIGINGAGKTTIIKLLLRFYKTSSGEILINDLNIKNYPLKELYQMFGVCFQDICSYALSLKDNISISSLDKKKNQEEWLVAIKASGVDKIFEGWPQGIHTNLSKIFDENGVELSKGQWQKIAIARTFYRDSPFVILDEPSSALDPEAEDYIFSSFQQLCKDKGGILISHRLSSILMVDEILFLEDGTVTEKGTHQELMKLQGKYAMLYQLQAEKYKVGVAYE